MQVQVPCLCTTFASGVIRKLSSLGGVQKVRQGCKVDVWVETAGEKCSPFFLVQMGKERVLWLFTGTSLGKSYPHRDLGHV